MCLPRHVSHCQVLFWHVAKKSVQMDYEEDNAEELRKVDQNGESIKKCV